MKGTIVVQDDLSKTSQLPETVCFLMVSTKDLSKHLSALKGNGIDIIAKYTFKDLRGEQKGAGPQQTLLVLGSSNSKDKLVSVLQSITPTLPYS